MMRKISKMVVFYNDGTYEELTPNSATLWGIQAGLPAQTNSPSPEPLRTNERCMVCSGFHGSLPCPYLTATAPSHKDNR